MLIHQSISRFFSVSLWFFFPVLILVFMLVFCALLGSSLTFAQNTSDNLSLDIYYTEKPEIIQLDNKAQKNLHKAIVMMAEQKWQIAYTILYDLLKQYPDNVAIRNNLAVVLLHQGQLQQARQQWVRILEREPITAIAYQNLKKLYSYAAAKTYSDGLNMLKPVQLPQLTLLAMQTAQRVVDTQTNLQRHQLKQESDILFARKNNSVSKPAQYLTAKNKSKNTGENGKADGLVQSEKAIRTTLKNKPAMQKTASKSVLPEPVPSKASQSLATQTVSKTSNRQRIRQVLEQWRLAWQTGDYQSYINLYTPDYAPNRMRRQRWLAERRQKVHPNKQIKLTLKNIKIKVFRNKQRAYSDFIQRYQSRNYRDRVKKRLYWKKIQGGWYIQREVILQVLAK